MDKCIDQNNYQNNFGILEVSGTIGKLGIWKHSIGNCLLGPASAEVLGSVASGLKGMRGSCGVEASRLSAQGTVQTRLYS